MNDEIFDDNQRWQVLETLQNVETKEWPLSEWYRGALHVLKDVDNPDRLSQAACSLREVVYKLLDMGIYIQKKNKNKKKRSIPIELQEDPLLEQSPSMIQQNRQEVNEDIEEILGRLNKYVHHDSNIKEKSKESFINECLQPLEKVILSDIGINQREIQKILDLSVREKKDEERMLSLIENNGANYRFFFKRAADPTWLPVLVEKGYFRSPPARYLADDGYIQFPPWPELEYLKKILDGASEEDTEKVVELVHNLPQVDNPFVGDDILDIALKLHGERSGRLSQKIFQCAEQGYQFIPFKYAEILAHWTREGQFSAALDLSKILVKFSKDPESQDKQDLKPKLRCSEWDYEHILKEGIRPLAASKPYETSRILIDAVDNMVGLDENWQDDKSDLWCPRIDGNGVSLNDAEYKLVYTLTFACEKVYEEAPDSIVALDGVLRRKRWKVFARLRHRLYARHPNEQTKPWIRDLILASDDYGKWDYSFEFQQMIRRACEHFGEGLLTKRERIKIFQAIRSGPPVLEDSQLTEDDLKKWQRTCHRIQLRPFESVLCDEHEDYFRELETEAGEKITDEDYLSIRVGKGGIVTDRSPTSSEELARLGDEGLLDYINEWEKEEHDYDKFIDVTIRALAKAFQSVFRESIIPAADRFGFWMENRERIKRPIYVRVMIEEMRERIKAKNFDRLDEWLDFCEWVLSHPDRRDGGGGERSREHPSWHTLRQEVGDFVEACVSKDVNAPISARQKLAKLLSMLCTQFDRRLDKAEPVESDSYISQAISQAIDNTRSRALESLVDFGFWLRRHDKEADVSTVTSIIGRRFSTDEEYPLSLPERAMLGMQYQNIFRLDEEWSTQHKSKFFPRDDFSAWRASFCSLLRYCRPFKRLFEVLYDDFEFALEHLDELGEQWIDDLGFHLCIYYLWEISPSRDLLNRYYDKTRDDQGRWARLFDHVGRCLRNTKGDLDSGLKERFMEFFEWRLGKKDPVELQDFWSWLESECLDAEWRLDAYSKVLSVRDDHKLQTEKQAASYSHELKPLVTLLPKHTDRVVECFLKLTNNFPKQYNYYLSTEDVQAILKAGVNSDDQNVRSHAHRTRDKLFREGYFSLSDIG